MSSMHMNGQGSINYKIENGHKAIQAVDRSMPPPPAPPVILQAEVDALSESLKKTAIKIGQFYRFYSDARRLGISTYAPQPPHSITSSLNTEIARYDQLCDVIESRLLHDIAILRRDLESEQEREKEEAERLLRLKLPVLESNITGLQVSEEPSVIATTGEAGVPDTVANSSQPKGTAPVGRRQSKISLSTLHRSPFPLKLDLSSSTLRLSMDEVSRGLTALGSPVTLAPKSARPTTANEIPPEILAALAASANAEHGMNIDLTIDDHIRTSGDMNAGFGVQSELGKSANEPIELDIDMGAQISDVNMTDIFGESVGTEAIGGNADIDSLFTPVTPSMPLPVQSQNEEVNMDMANMAILDALSTVNEPGPSNDLFGSMDPELGTSSETLMVEAGSRHTQSLPISSLDRENAESLPASSSFLYDSSELNISDMPNFDSEFFSNNDTDMDLMNTILNIDSSTAKTDK